MFSTLLVSILAVSAMEDPLSPRLDWSLEEYCALYKEKEIQEAEETIVKAIQRICTEITADHLQSKNRPVYNFRAAPADFCDAEENCSIFRGGQIAAMDLTEEERQGFRDRQLGFRSTDLRDSFKIEFSISLRFDPKVRSTESLFGSNIPRLPLSSGEAIYSYSNEDRYLTSLGIQSLYIPSPPELEHFVGQYVPRLDNVPDAKPYVCRLPKNLPDGAEKHWLNAWQYYRDNLEIYESQDIFPILTSQSPECTEWIQKYGIDKVRSWTDEVIKTAKVANFIFQSIAKFLVEAERPERRVFFHCSSGSDRVGRVGLYFDLYRMGVTKGHVIEFKGPGTNAKIDLALMNYLLSQRAGASVKYQYIVPNQSRMDLSVLLKAFDNVEQDFEVPEVLKSLPSL